MKEISEKSCYNLIRCLTILTKHADKDAMIRNTKLYNAVRTATIELKKLKKLKRNEKDK